MKCCDICFHIRRLMETKQLHEQECQELEEKLRLSQDLNCDFREQLERFLNTFFLNTIPVKQCQIDVKLNVKKTESCF